MKRNKIALLSDNDILHELLQVHEENIVSILELDQSFREVAQQLVKLFQTNSGTDEELVAFADTVNTLVSVVETRVMVMGHIVGSLTSTLSALDLPHERIIRLVNTVAQHVQERQKENEQ